MPGLQDLPQTYLEQTKQDQERSSAFYDTISNDKGQIDYSKFNQYTNKYYSGTNVQEYPDRYVKSSDANTKYFAADSDSKELNPIIKEYYGPNTVVYGATEYSKKGPLVQVYKGPDPLGVLVHEVAHTELDGNPGASMDTGRKLPYTGLEKARERYMNMPSQLTAPGGFWAEEQPGDKNGDMLAELKRYEATLPADTHILNTPVGNYLFPTKDEKLAYLIHSQPLYTQKGYEPSEVPSAVAGNWQKDLVNKGTQLYNKVMGRK